MDAPLADESLIRVSVFLVVLALLALLEAALPRRRRLFPRARRWTGNLGIVLLNTVLLRFGFPVAAIGMAALAETRGWGLFNLVPAPGWLAFAISFVLLDLAIWAQHLLFHRVPLFWRFHRMHHADLDFDVTTGLRFHPGEIVLSMAIKLGLVAALGPPVLAVLMFEIVLNATSMFSHANLKLPLAADRLLRLVVVTPDMHRVHHSVRREETDSNFGFNLACWDRLFGTYRAQPKDGHDRMTIGLEQFRDPRELRIEKMLSQPLRRASL